MSVYQRGCERIARADCVLYLDLEPGMFVRVFWITE